MGPVVGEDTYIMQSWDIKRIGGKYDYRIDSRMFHISTIISIRYGVGRDRRNSRWFIGIIFIQYYCLFASNTSDLDR